MNEESIIIAARDDLGHILPMKHRIERRSIPENIRDSLQERILSGEFKDGDALIQDVVADEYGVSRIPVREALRQLEARGLVAVEPHKGAVITTIPSEQIEELFALRALLECDTLSLAIPRTTDQNIAEARQALDRLEEAYHDQDTTRWGGLNWAFHRTLYAPAGRSQTLALLEGINLKLERYIRLHLAITHETDAAAREHRDLLRLCAVRDVDGAVAFLRVHILDTAQSLLAALRGERAR